MGGGVWSKRIVHIVWLCVCVNVGVQYYTCM